jgi:beta-1,2-mannosidase
MGDNWVSSIGHAVSADGEVFERDQTPLLQAEDDSYSIEDPRITQIDDTFYLTHTFYDGLNVKLQQYTSEDLKTWQAHGEMMPDWDFQKAGGFLVDSDPVQAKANKDPVARRKWAKSGAIIPERIDGKIWMLFGDRYIWLASSSDGIKYNAVEEPFIRPRGEPFFDSQQVEMGPPPIKTDQGWLVLYHGINKEVEYKLGYALLDSNDPSKILRRGELPIFQPSEPYELSGIVDILPGGYEAMKAMNEEELQSFVATSKEKGDMPKVVFCCGAVMDDPYTLRIYYGAADSLLCTATVKLADVLRMAQV